MALPDGDTMSLTKFPIEWFRKGKTKLGKGGQGSVRVYEKTTSVFNRLFVNSSASHLPDQVAVKKIEGNIENDLQLRREVSFLEQANHPNIVKYYGYFPIDTNSDITGIAMEICNGTLKDLVRARDLNSLEIAYLSYQLLLGVEYLHDDLKVHHRDIKPGNMLLKTMDGSQVSSWSNVNVFNLCLKIADFGLCRQLSNSKPSDSKTITVVGSLNWLAPEVKEAMVLEAKSEFAYNKYSDIWGCGCVSYYLAKKKPPEITKDCNNLCDDHSLLQFGFANFLQNQLQYNRRERFSAKKLLDQPFLTMPFETLISEAQRSGKFDSINDICMLKTTEDISSLVYSLKVVMRWSDKQIAHFLLRGKLESLKDNFKYLSGKEAVIEAINLFRHGEYRRHTNIKALLSESLSIAAACGNLGIVKWLIMSGVQANSPGELKFTALQRACWNGHYSIAQYLVNVGEADVNAVFFGTDTALYLAATYGYTEIVKLLCEFGAEVNKKNMAGETALHRAVEKSHYSTVEYLVKETISDVNVSNYTGDTPLHIAASKGQAQTIKMLVEYGAQMFKENNNGTTPFDVAVKKNHCEIMNSANARDANLFQAAHEGDLHEIRRLCESGAIVNKRNQFGTTALHLAIDGGHYSVVKYLVDTAKMSVNLSNSENDTALHCAAKNGHIKIVKFLCQTSVNINRQNESDDTALHLASSYGCPQTVQVLCEYGVEVNRRNISGETALYRASKSGHCSIVKYLVEVAKADINLTSNEGDTVLHCAAKYDHFEVVKVLCQTANINLANPSKDTALHLASSYGCPQTVQVLCEYGAEVNRRNISGETALYRASKGGHCSIVKYLVEVAKADINLTSNEGDTVLHCAAKNDDFEVVKVLCQTAKINQLNVNGDTALHLASSHGCLQAVQVLCEFNAEVNRKNMSGETALSRACKGGHYSTVRYLVDFAKATINLADNYGNASLNEAAKHGHTETVRFLCNSGANVRNKNVWGNTALHIASINGRCSTVDVLLKETNAEVNMTSSKEVTALHEAASHGHLEIVKLLCESGAFINNKMSFGETALHRACAAGHYSIAEYLINQMKADITMSDNCLDSPLVAAAKNGHSLIVQLLCDSGAEVNKQNNFHETALHLGCLHGHISVVKVLLKRGADKTIMDLSGRTAVEYAGMLCLKEDPKIRRQLSSLLK